MEPQTLRLATVVTLVALGTGFQIYSTSVVNNLESIVRSWLNCTYQHRHSRPLSSYQLDAFWSVIVACMTGGSCVGAGTVFLISEHLGRKRGLILCGTLSVVGAVLAGLARVSASFEMLMIGRLTMGYSLGVQMGLAGLFLTEIAPLKYRGASGAAIGLFFGFGDFCATVFSLPMILGSESLWPIAFAMPGLPALLQVLTLIFSHESPRYLYLTKGDITAANRSLEFYQSPEDSKLTTLELEAEIASQQQRQVTSFGRFLTSKKYRRQIILALVLNAGSSLSGIDALMSYSASMFENAGLSLRNSQFASAGIGTCNFFVPFIAVSTVEKHGRRPLSLAGLSGCLLAISLNTLLTGIITLGHVNHPGLSYASVASLIFYVICFGIQQPVAVFLTSEIFEQDVRSKGMTMASMAFFGCGAIQVIAYPSFNRAVGVTYSFMPFVLATVCSVTFLYLRLPETKGRTVEETAAKIRGNMGHQELVTVKL